MLTRPRKHSPLLRTPDIVNVEANARNRWRARAATVAGVAPALARYEFFFNYERPHTSLAYRTPNEYLVVLEAA